MRWVLPRPTPPYRKSGLYALPGASATARQAAWAKRLELPTTNVLKVNAGLSRESLAPSSGSLTYAYVGSGTIGGASGGGDASGSTVMITSQSRPSTPERVSRISGTQRSLTQARRNMVGTQA